MLVPPIRTLRMLAFVTIAGGLYVGVYLLRLPYELPAQLTIVLATFGAAVFAERLGLASLSVEATALDRDTQPAVETLARDPTAAADRFDGLIERAQRLEPVWAVAERLLRQAALRRSPDRAPEIELRTRSAAFEAAGPTLVVRGSAWPRAPATAVRHPRGRGRGPPLVPQGVQEHRPRRGVDDRPGRTGSLGRPGVRNDRRDGEIPLRDRQTQLLRDELVRQLRLELDIATGDQAEEAIRMYEQAIQAIGSPWDELERYLGISATGNRSYMLTRWPAGALENT
ncbi:MAG TPA: hypothetical protein VFS32_04435 [Candidatus Limnocylindrales bacterium]|nr:hypothetical protein [Candidatus Limnocylindrales bacterium]